MLQYVESHLYIVSTSLFAVLIMANMILLLFFQTIVIKYLVNIYALVGMLYLYISSNKIYIEIAYKDNYLYGFVIYSIVLSMIFAIINRYFANLIYKYLYDFMLYCLRYLNVDESFMIYVRFYNILNQLDIKDNVQLIDYLQTYDGVQYDSSNVQLFDGFDLALSIRIENEYIVNDSNIALIFAMHFILLFMSINNIYYMTYYFILAFIFLVVMFMNVSVCNGAEMLFINKFRCILLIIGFVLYMIYEMYLYQICLTLFALCVCIYLTYRSEQDYFYAKSDISFVCKFFYGRYLKFIVWCITLISFVFIAYMEYMSLYLYKNGNEPNDDITTVF